MRSGPWTAMISASISVRSAAAYVASAYRKRLMGPAKRGSKCGVLSMHTCCWWWMRSRNVQARPSTAGTSLGGRLFSFRSDSGRLRLASLIPLFLCFLWAAVNASAADCATCHDHAQKLAKSAHTAVACATCHQGHNEYPHPAGIPKPACTTCHASQAQDYEGSAHGQAARIGNSGAPDCALCHGSAHELLSPRSPEFRAKTPETCGMCHDKVVEEYRGSVHG